MHVSKRNQSAKSPHCMIAPVWNSGKVKIVFTVKLQSLGEVWREGEMEKESDGKGEEWGSGTAQRGSK